MHTYPIILVTAETLEDAIDAASSWVDEQFANDCPYDFGGVAAEDAGIKPEDKAKLVLRSGTDDFRAAVESKLQLEKESLREEWDCARSLFAAFGDLKEPPAPDAKFLMKYDMAHGVGPGLIEAGTHFESETTADMGIWRCGRLNDIHHHIHSERTWARTTLAGLYDDRDDRKNPLELGPDDEVWAVVLDFHF